MNQMAFFQYRFFRMGRTFMVVLPCEYGFKNEGVETSCRKRENDRKGSIRHFLKINLLTGQTKPENKRTDSITIN